MPTVTVEAVLGRFEGFATVRATAKVVDHGEDREPEITLQAIEGDGIEYLSDITTVERARLEELAWLQYESALRELDVCLEAIHQEALTKLRCIRERGDLEEGRRLILRTRAAVRGVPVKEVA